MTLEQVKNIIEIFIRKNVEPERFDEYLNKAQEVLFMQYADAKAWDMLRPFEVVLDGNELPKMHFTSGRSELPTDYVGRPNGIYNNVLINFVTDEDYDDLSTHKIEYPTADYPIANISSDFIRILPKTIRYITFSYIKKPGAVHFGYTTTGGYIAYDALSSVELAWDETNIIKIILLVLQDFGIQATADEVKSKTKN